MRVLLTGAGGQLGQCLQDRLAETGHDVLALSRTQLDITNADAVLSRVSAFAPAAIINAAAYTAVDKAESEPEEAWRINVEAVSHLASAANAVGALLVQVSTDYVFDGLSARPYCEADTPNPQTVYGKSKLAGECAAAGASKHLIVRVGWLFSEYGNNFLKTMVRLGVERDELSIVADQYGTPTYAGDLAAALIQLIPANPPLGIYHFSGGEICSWFEFAERIFAQAEAVLPHYRAPKISAIRSGAYPTPAKRPTYSVLSDGNLRAYLSSPTGDWGSAIDRVLVKLGT